MHRCTHTHAGTHNAHTHTHAHTHTRRQQQGREHMSINNKGRTRTRHSLSSALRVQRQSTPPPLHATATRETRHARFGHERTDDDNRPPAGTHQRQARSPQGSQSGRGSVARDRDTPCSHAHARGCATRAPARRVHGVTQPTGTQDTTPGQPAGVSHRAVHTPASAVCASQSQWVCASQWTSLHTTLRCRRTMPGMSR